jgi:hypothetical protein
MDYDKEPLYKPGREVYYIFKQTENVFYNRNRETMTGIVILNYLDSSKSVHSIESGYKLVRVLQ